MYFIDTHTHIYLPEFDDDRDAMISRALSAGVEYLFLPAIDGSTHGAMLQTAGRHDCCRVMMGLHPCSVNQDFEKELDLVTGHLRNGSFIAVGETGLDFYWDKTFVELQYQSFHRQIALCLEYDLPVVIHSRNAIDACLDVVVQYPGLKGVFHCFSGNYDQASRVLDAGMMLGIGGVVTFRNSGLDRVVEKTGLGGVILETDAPYLAPVPHRGRRNEPAYTRLVAEKLSSILGLPLEKIAELTSHNARRLFSL